MSDISKSILNLIFSRPSTLGENLPRSKSAADLEIKKKTRYQQMQEVADVLRQHRYCKRYRMRSLRFKSHEATKEEKEHRLLKEQARNDQIEHYFKLYDIPSDLVNPLSFRGTDKTSALSLLNQAFGVGTGTNQLPMKYQPQQPRQLPLRTARSHQQLPQASPQRKVTTLSQSTRQTQKEPSRRTSSVSAAWTIGSDLRSRSTTVAKAPAHASRGGSQSHRQRQTVQFCSHGYGSPGIDSETCRLRKPPTLKKKSQISTLQGNSASDAFISKIMDLNTPGILDTSKDGLATTSDGMQIPMIGRRKKKPKVPPSFHLPSILEESSKSNLQQSQQVNSSIYPPKFGPSPRKSSGGSSSMLEQEDHEVQTSFIQPLSGSSQLNFEGAPTSQYREQHERRTSQLTELGGMSLPTSEMRREARPGESAPRIQELRFQDRPTHSTRENQLTLQGSLDATSNFPKPISTSIEDEREGNLTKTSAGDAAQDEFLINFLNNLETAYQPKMPTSKPERKMIPLKKCKPPTPFVQQKINHLRRTMDLPNKRILRIVPERLVPKFSLHDHIEKRKMRATMNVAPIKEDRPNNRDLFDFENSP